MGSTRQIAALYVQAGGSYYGLDGVDPWDEKRDARGYDGPWPVVAHPPCSRWCKLAPVNQKRWGAMVGDDGGTFEAALDTVRKFGGVLEHPAYSIAWERYGLTRPVRGQWTGSPEDPGLVTEVSQCAYGHRARKRTWLYTVGVEPIQLDWSEPKGKEYAVIGGGPNGQSPNAIKIGPKEASKTPEAFRDILIGMARSVNNGFETLRTN